ncbi:MAG: hypothetical protein M1817_000173 [Caeruleum heppii]|nr:MAG: hypothetical protein M1817_000173 [Caeruleum heppii]
MAEPQPPSTHEGADVEEDTPALPKSAEDRKAAAALSSVTAVDDDKPQPRGADQEALGKAMKNLDLDQSTAAKPTANADEKTKKAVKVDPIDVTLLVEELDLTKPKATDLLKSYDGDAVKAMRAFVTASA